MRYRIRFREIGMGDILIDADCLRSDSTSLLLCSNDNRIVAAFQKDVVLFIIRVEE